MGSWNRRGPIEPAFTTAIPWSRPRKGTCECPHTTTDASARACEAGRVRAELRAVDGDVEEEHRDERAVPVAHVEGDDVGDAGHLRVDVAANGGDGRVDRQGVEHGGRADVAGVEDVVGPLRRDDLGAARIGAAVRVGDDDDAQGSVGAKLERLVRMDELSHGTASES